MRCWGSTSPAAMPSLGHDSHRPNTGALSPGQMKPSQQNTNPTFEQAGLNLLELAVEKGHHGGVGDDAFRLALQRIHSVQGGGAALSRLTSGSPAVPDCADLLRMCRKGSPSCHTLLTSSRSTGNWKAGGRTTSSVSKEKPVASHKANGRAT